MKPQITSSPEWIDYYSLEHLFIIQEYLNEVNSNVLVFKCSCCDEWSACLADNYDVVMPVNRDSKEEMIDWCKGNNFTVVGEVVNEEPIYYN
jgi:hypothetical protein